MTKLEMTRDDLVEAIAAELLALKHPPEKLYEVAERVADRFRLETQPIAETTEPMVASAVKMYDLVAEQDFVYPNGARKARIRWDPQTRKRVPVMRDPKTLTHLVLHQTAVEFGVSSHQVRASGGDRELALARRFLDVACHAAACRSGFFVLTHPLTAWLNHGNGFNRYSIGFEVDGRYAGLEDDPSTAAREDLLTTWKGDPTTLTSRTVRATRAGCAHIIRKVRALGAPMNVVVAHRQSSGTRKSDPGQAIWQRVVPWLVDELGMKIEPAEVLVSEKSGPGRPVPVQWDPDGVGDY